MHTTHDSPPSRIELDSGEILELDEPGGTPTDGYVRLRVPAHRALDLAKVLRAYGRIVDLVSTAAEVSATEDSLGRALHDGATAAGGTSAPTGRNPVSTRDRLRAMAVIQRSRPTLSHTALVGVVEAAARWIEADEYDLAMGLVEAAVGDQATAAVWSALVRQDRLPPRPPEAR